MSATASVQNSYLKLAMESKRTMRVRLSSGNDVTGIIKGFDNFTILITTTQKHDVLIFKSGIAAVGPGE